MDKQKLQSRKRCSRFYLHQRIITLILAVLIVISTAGPKFFTVYGADDSNEITFTVSGEELVRAVQEAVALGQEVSEGDIEFTNGQTEKFENLLYGGDKLYEVYPEFEGYDDPDAEVRVFVSQTGKDLAEEDLIFLYLNHTDETIRCRTRVSRTDEDGDVRYKKTESVTIKSYEAVFGEEEILADTATPSQATPSEAFKEEVEIPKATSSQADEKEPEGEDLDRATQSQADKEKLPKPSKNDLAGVDWCSTAKAVVSSLDQLKAFEDVDHFSVDYLVEPEEDLAKIKGPSSIEAGGELSFQVWPKDGYEIQSVTADGMEIQEATPSQAEEVREGAKVFRIPGVDQDTTVVVEIGEDLSEEVYQVETLLDNTLRFEDENFSVDLKIQGTAVANLQEPETDLDPEATPSQAQEQKLKLQAVPIADGQPEYEAAEAYAEKTGGEQGVVGVSAVNLEFYYDEQPLDVSGCAIQAAITPKAQVLSVQEPATASMARTAEEKDEKISVTALDMEGEEARELGTLIIEDELIQTPVLEVAVNSLKPVLMVAATRSAGNPGFKVQYYANLDVVKTSGSNALNVIDTSGRNLPSNGSTPPIKNIYLTDAGNGKHRVDTETKLTEVYQAKDYEYSSAPGLEYFNVLSKNGNYELKEIWILKDGKDAGSTVREDWDIYSYEAGKVDFTNNPEAANPEGDPKTLLITDQMVMRLVFDPTDETYNNTANFYDYDITGDGTHTYQNGSAQGINSPGNYSGSGVKLAFGNANTGTGLQNESWNGNTLNQYNRTGGGYQGCTFGLVEGLDENGRIQYADGVNAPKLFQDGDAAGKTSYTQKEFSLDFKRSGDTYTLSAVKGSSVSGLEYFNHPTCGTTTYDHIWTNNFWPMDRRAGKDGLTGYVNNRGSYIGISGNNLYPPSDDGIAHNNMFGMEYGVQFELTSDYVGPLEYYFFGDDDMWVFLDDQLVCDIGGVHSSVGEYVNLWDYVEKGSSGTHTLSFFYTERGLSGSTCYMQFTLPSVSSATPGQETGNLTIEKRVAGNTEELTGEEFTFEIQLENSEGEVLVDEYSYTRYDANNQSIESGTIGSGDLFQLKAGERIAIRNLPSGTQYTIEEAASDRYSVSYQINGEDEIYSEQAQDSISADESNVNVIYTNTVRPMLPETGGRGTRGSCLGGLGLMVLPSFYLFRRRKKEDC